MVGFRTLRFVESTCFVTRSALELQIKEENTRLADEQKARLTHLNQVVYTNRPSIDYFSQFNTSTR